MKPFFKGILFFAVTWLIMTVIVIFIDYLFFRPENYQADFITYFAENFETDFIIIFFAWGIFTLLSILAYYKIKSGN